MTENPFEKFVRFRNSDPDEAKFFWSGGPVEVAERTWFQSMLSSCIGFDTDDGLVLIDSGTVSFAPGLADLLRAKTQAPIHTAIFTHGHVDHAFGLDQFLVEGQSPPRVIAHQATVARFARYERTTRHNAAINARQFGGAVTAVDDDPTYQSFKRPSIMPDTLYEDAMTVTVGGLTFELYHCRGETDDHTWVWCPEREVLCPGDLFIYGVPNAGNPQKAQRYPWDWAAGLRKMATLHPRTLCPGHGGPVVNDPEKIQRMLLETADYLDSLVNQTVAALEEGSPPHVDIVRSVTPPATDSPWLQPVYDEAEFIVRNTIRYYGGWWSGRPSELKPAARASVAGEIAALAGGPAALLQRAEELAAAGDQQLGCHLADYALEAAPEDADVQNRVAALYTARAEGETSLMAMNLYNSAAAYARAGRPYA